MTRHSLRPSHSLGRPNSRRKTGHMLGYASLERVEERAAAASVATWVGLLGGVVDLLGLNWLLGGPPGGG